MGRRSEAGGSTSRAFWAIVGVAGVVGAGWTLVLAKGSFFATDDHVYFAQDRELPFGWHFLSEPLNDHFSPWHRLLDHVVSSLTDQGWWLALVISVGWYLAAVAAFAVLARRLFGTHPAGTAASVVFALSPIFVQATQWWALGAQLYPELVFSLLALIWALKWMEGRRRRDLVLAVAAYALALCAFIKALLVLPLLVLVLYLRPELAGSLKDRLRPIWREDRWLWLCLAAVTLIYLSIISDDRYYRFIGSAPAPTTQLFVKYLIAAWGEGVAPLALGGTVPKALGPGHWLVLLVTNAFVVGLVVACVRSARSSAWTWAGAGLVVVGGMVMSGAARVSTEGVEVVALDPRYNAEGVLALLLAGALAARAAWPGASLQVPGRAARLSVAGICLLAAALAADSGLRLERNWIGPVHRAYFDTFSRSLAARPDVDIIDSAVPQSIVQASIAPYNLTSRVLPLQEPQVRVGTGVGPPAGIDSKGRVTPVRLRPIAASPRAGCAPLTIRVDAGPSEDAIVLSLRRSGPLPTVDASVTADSGVVGGQVVRGFPIPQIFATTLRIPEGQRGARILAGIGATRTLTLTPPPGQRLCVEDARVGRFRLLR